MNEQAQAEINAIRMEMEQQACNLLHELGNRAALIAVLNIKVQAGEKKVQELEAELTALKAKKK